MNKIFGITALGLGMLTMASCTDFLDTTSTSETPKDELFESPAQTALVVNKIYGDLCAENYTQSMTMHHGAGTDVELIDGIGATATAASERGAINYNATANGWNKLGSLWETQYTAIEHCNQVIDGINNSNLMKNGKEADKQTMKRYLGEAYTVRAMVYLDLVRVFGDIPFMEHAAKSDLSNVNVGKTDRDAILDKMIENLEEVVTGNYLPWAGSTMTTEHVTMGYAEALLANIYMTRAGWAIREAGGQAEGKPYSVAAKEAAGYEIAAYSDDVYKTMRPDAETCRNLYTKAAAHLKNVIDKGVHKMNKSFYNEWYLVNQLQLDGANHENMFEIPMGFGNTGELGYTIGVRINGENAEWGYGNSSGKVKTTGVMLYSYEPCDQRRDITCVSFEIRANDYNLVNGQKQVIESVLKNKPFGLYVGKWDVRKMSDRWKQYNKTATAKFGYGINVVRMRYPQVLLWYAECLNELNGGPTEEAKRYLAEVHARAYNEDGARDIANFYAQYYAPEELPAEVAGGLMTAQDYYINNYMNNFSGTKAAQELDAWKNKLNTVNDKDEFLNLICEENKLEFCGEGFRKWDLIRWNKLHQLIWKAKTDYYASAQGTSKAKYGFQAKVYFKYLDAAEKHIDWPSATWYGTNGTNLIKGDDPAANSNEWLNDNGYPTTKGANGAKGADYKGLNQDSYQQASYATAYDAINTELPSICGGLVGTQNVFTGNCTDEGVAVKNRYLMPIYQNTIDGSMGRLYNSYGY